MIFGGVPPRIVEYLRFVVPPSMPSGDAKEIEGSDPSAHPGDEEQYHGQQYVCDHRCMPFTSIRQDSATDHENDVDEHGQQQAQTHIAGKVVIQEPVFNCVIK